MSLHRAEWADKWFRTLESTVHLEVGTNRKDSQKPVRIAILDTGVDGTHPEIQSALQEKRIVAHKGFPPSLDPLRDQNGHGTHGVSVLMKTAPTAVIYVGRVANDDGNLSESNGFEETAKATSRFL
jgi:subtilisin family serine protease